jgi:endonuclease/exonuclease/phosphatase family metal-dependent hydrolase
VCFCVRPLAADEKQSQLPADVGVPVIEWKDAANYVDKTVIVQGKIVQSKNIGRHCFLNFDAARSFTAVIHEPSYANFPKPPEEMYDQKVVRVRGVVSEYNGKPQIEVTRPDQITLLDEEKPVPPPIRPRERPFSGTVTIATFNVLHLFDDHDDPYREDESTPAKPKDQLEKVAAALRSIDADVVALEEVENRELLERFVAALLPDLGYENVVCFEGNDHRGIDCAVLSRFPVGPVTSHRHLRFSDGSGGQIQFQRDFLQVQVQPPGGPPFFVLPVHFKSKRGGAEPTERVRLAETRQARKILDDLLKREKDALFVVCGDFNDTWESAPLKALRGDDAGALHGFVQDAPKGARTYNQGEHADAIDFILASPAMAKRYVPKSYRIVSGDIESLGSDHNPVVAQFKLR